MTDKENKKTLCEHSGLAHVIVFLFGFILVLLVFMAGIMVGWSKTGYPSSKADYYHKDYIGKCDYYMSKKNTTKQYETKAEAMGMTVVEFKKYLAEQKAAGYEEYKTKAEEKGMTIEEYKEYLTEQKK